MSEIQTLKDALEGVGAMMGTLAEDDTPLTWDDLDEILLDALTRQRRDAKASSEFSGDVGPEEPQEVLEDTPEPLPEPEGILFRDLPNSNCPTCGSINYSRVNGCKCCTPSLTQKQYLDILSEEQGKA